MVWLGNDLAEVIIRLSSLHDNRLHRELDNLEMLMMPKEKLEHMNTSHNYISDRMVEAYRRTLNWWLAKVERSELGIAFNDDLLDHHYGVNPWVEPPQFSYLTEEESPY